MELRNKRAALWEGAKAFLDSHSDKDGKLSAEDAAAYDRMEADVVALGKDIERLERQAAIDAELAKPTAEPIVNTPKADVPEKTAAAIQTATPQVAVSSYVRQLAIYLPRRGRTQLQLGSDMRYTVQPTKTNAGTRRIPITEDVAECFKAILEDRERRQVEHIVDGYSGFLFPDREGLPLVAMHWEHRFRHMVGRYNEIFRIQIPKITPHICRHTYCSNMARSGMRRGAVLGKYIPIKSALHVSSPSWGWRQNMQDSRSGATE